MGTSSGPASVASGRRWRASPGPKTSVRSTHVACTPASSKHPCSHGALRALGQPEAAAPAVAEARAVRLDAGAHLQAHARVGGQQRQHRVRRRAGPRREGRQRGRAGRPAGARSATRVLARRALELGRHGGVVGRLDVERVRGRAHVAQEGAAALERARRLELVAQHRRQRERERRARLAARRAAAGRRSRSPPTATPRRTATSRSPRRRADGSAGRWPGGPRSWLQHGHEVQRAIEVALGPQGEVARGDGGHEAVVERLGQPQRGMDPIPARRAAPARGRAAGARGTGRRARPSRSAPRTARGTPRRGTRAGATGCPSARRPSGASVRTLGVDTYAVPPARSMPLTFSSTPSGSWTCSIVCRKTTASHGSEYVSTMLRTKRRLGAR